MLDVLKEYLYALDVYKRQDEYYADNLLQWCRDADANNGVMPYDLQRTEAKIDGKTSVSYTHLDVYKRQDLDSQSKSFFVYSIVAALCGQVSSHNFIYDPSF